MEVTGTDGVDFSFLTTSTNGKGQGGELNINTKNLTVADGGQIAASTPAGLGKGGSININASESVELFGFQQLADRNILYSGLSASAGERNSQIQSTKNSGSLKIDTEQLTVRDGAEMTVSNFGTGKGGNLTIDANSVFLENDAILNAATRSGKGGNIKLENVDILVLQNRAQITTSAGDRGNGGNLLIDADTLTLLDNSRIAAGAVQGKGGVIQIQTQGLFQSSDSKVTAASEVGIDGIVQIERPGIDSNQAITELPETIIDVRGLIGNSCSGENFAENKFTLIGRGGLPLDPDRGIELSTVQADLGDFSTIQSNALGQALGFSPSQNTTPTTQAIVEAQRWFKNIDGKIVLVGNNPIVSDRNFSSNSLACNVR
jgi:large exoprotein involved in heme utilization and adhesion